jgi:hypothetical protein
VTTTTKTRPEKRFGQKTAIKSHSHHLKQLEHLLKGQNHRDRSHLQKQKKNDGGRRKQAEK